jgi:hypothetical protein
MRKSKTKVKTDKNVNNRRNRKVHLHDCRSHKYDTLFLWVTMKNEIGTIYVYIYIPFI